MEHHLEVHGGGEVTDTQLKCLVQLQFTSYPPCRAWDQIQLSVAVMACSA